MSFKSLIFVKIFGVDGLVARGAYLGLIRHELKAGVAQLLTSTGPDGSDFKVVVYFPQEYLVPPGPILVEVSAYDFLGDPSALFDLIGNAIRQHFSDTRRQIFLQSASPSTPLLRQY